MLMRVVRSLRFRSGTLNRTVRRRLDTLHGRVRRRLDMLRRAVRRHRMATRRVSEPRRSEEVTVSVVVPVKDAGAELTDLIVRMKEQKGFRAVEIVIVDSGSTDGSAETAEALGATVVRIAPEEFSHSYARNFGRGARDRRLRGVHGAGRAALLGPVAPRDVLGPQAPPGGGGLLRRGAARRLRSLLPRHLLATSPLHELAWRRHGPVPLAGRHAHGGAGATVRSRTRRA